MTTHVEYVEMGGGSDSGATPAVTAPYTYRPITGRAAWAARWARYPMWARVLLVVLLGGGLIVAPLVIGVLQGTGNLGGGGGGGSPNPPPTPPAPPSTTCPYDMPTWSVTSSDYVYAGSVGTDPQTTANCFCQQQLSVNAASYTVGSLTTTRSCGGTYCPLCTSFSEIVCAAPCSP